MNSQPAEGRDEERLTASMAGAASAAQGLGADMGVARQYVAAALEGAAGDSPLGALMQGVLVCFRQPGVALQRSEHDQRDQASTRASVLSTNADAAAR